MQYAALARNYDLWMRQDQPISLWVDSILAEFSARGIRPGAKVLDLACGTGGITIPLAQAGYDLVAMDLSEEMLSVARDKAAALGLPGIRWVCRDMAQGDFPGRYDAIICCCDGVNYLTCEEQLSSMLTACAKSLVPGGLLLFDVSAPAKLLPMAGQLYALDTDEGAYIWYNELEASDVIRMDITLFLPDGTGRFERHEEMHRQRAWKAAEIKTALKDAGLEKTEIREAFTAQKPQKGSLRWQVLAQSAAKKKQK